MDNNGNLAVNLASKLVKIVSFVLVVWALIIVVNQRLDTLKENNLSMLNGYVPVSVKMRELDCLTKNIYWEAASEPFEGKVAVAQVTLNRVESGRFPDSVCGVVHQKNIVYEKVICQFSWYCENTYKIKPVHREMWKESEEVAKKVLFENFRLSSMKNALYYHADYVSPNWRKPKIDQIGRHIFYGEKQ